jgi:hypothetical protein
MALKAKPLFFLALLLGLLIVPAALALTYTVENVFNINSSYITGILTNTSLSTISSAKFLAGILSDIGLSTFSINPFFGTPSSPGVFTLGIKTFFSGLTGPQPYTFNIAVFSGLSSSLANTLSVQAIGCTDASDSASCTPLSVISGGGGGAGGGGAVITPNLPPLMSWTIAFAIIGLPALLLASAAGLPGLFIGLILGIGLGVATNILPVWLIILLAMGLILLLASRWRGREE